MLLFYSLHYPKPGQEAALVKFMREVDEVMQRQPGIVFVAPVPFRDPARECLMGITVWETAEALQAAMPAIQRAWAAAPVGEWERQPPEAYQFQSVE